jgi:hypothetical protein
MLSMSVYVLHEVDAIDCAKVILTASETRLKDMAMTLAQLMTSEERCSNQKCVSYRSIELDWNSRILQLFRHTRRADFKRGYAAQ